MYSRPRDAEKLIHAQYATKKQEQTLFKDLRQGIAILNPAGWLEKWLITQSRYTYNFTVEWGVTIPFQRGGPSRTMISEWGVSPLPQKGGSKNTRWFISHYDFRMGCDPPSPTGWFQKYKVFHLTLWFQNGGWALLCLFLKVVSSSNNNNNNTNNRDLSMTCRPSAAGKNRAKARGEISREKAKKKGELRSAVWKQGCQVGDAIAHFTYLGEISDILAKIFVNKNAIKAQFSGFLAKYFPCLM